ncbi:MAG: dienelactone hydrolase family protein [Vicinamibacterales bacterium]
MEPHGGQRVVSAGTPLGRSDRAVIMVHGRGAGPDNILDLVPALDHPGFTYVAPAAANNTWYPYSFLSETTKNEPGLSSGLAVIGGLVDQLIATGIPRKHIVLLGFSQGACLAAEFSVRHADRFGGVIAFSGGLIGPPGTEWNYPGSLAGTPVFLGCSTVDAHIPAERVEASARVFAQMGAAVTKRLYPEMGHLVNDDEIAFARSVMDRV